MFIVFPIFSIFNKQNDCAFGGGNNELNNYFYGIYFTFMRWYEMDGFEVLEFPKGVRGKPVCEE